MLNRDNAMRTLLASLLARGVTRADLTILMLRYADGMTYAEIAAVTGVDAGTAAETIDAVKAALKAAVRDRMSLAAATGKHPAAAPAGEIL